jgi:NTP pyrophosphohydrolases including oxidative damage repair enzymes
MITPRIYIQTKQIQNVKVFQSPLIPTLKQFEWNGSGGHDKTTMTVPAIFGSSMFDAMTLDPVSTGVREKIHHYEKCLVNLSEILDDSGSPIVLLSPAAAATGITCKNAIGAKPTGKGPWIVPLARAIEYKPLLSTECPTVDLNRRNFYSNDYNSSSFQQQQYRSATAGAKRKRYKPFVSLSAVALIVDSQNRVLLTRRSEHLRTFPKAWVLPGGGIDPGESILDGVIREVKEETGLTVIPKDVEPVACWESCFPTSGQECVDSGKGILAHHLVVFCKCRVSHCHVVLQEDETDMAVWLDQEQFEMIVRREYLPGGHERWTDVSVEVAVASTSTSNVDDCRNMSSRSIQIPLDHLCGIYPRGDVCCGIAQGSRFMIEEFFQTQNNSMYQSKM